jgi:hypothetical protein
LLHKLLNSAVEPERIDDQSIKGGLPNRGARKMGAFLSPYIKPVAPISGYLSVFTHKNSGVGLQSGADISVRLLFRRKLGVDRGSRALYILRHD